jgi:uncharacterized membrane protein
MIKTILKLLLAAFFVLAGINHFVSADFYARIMPTYLPAHLLLVYLSGVAEIALGVLLVFRRSQQWAAWGLIALLIAVFPANIHMAMDSGQYPEFSPAALWWRLPVQGIFIALCYWYTRRDTAG